MYYRINASMYLSLECIPVCVLLVYPRVAIHMAWPFLGGVDIGGFSTWWEMCIKYDVHFFF